MNRYWRCIAVRYNRLLLIVALISALLIYAMTCYQLVVPWSKHRPQKSEITAKRSRNFQTYLTDELKTIEHDVMEYSNPTVNVHFKLRLALSPVDQWSVLNLTRYMGDIELFVPRRKLWMDEEKKSMAWRNLDILGMRKISFSTKFKSPCWFVHSTLRCLPYFYLIGAPKCGTTDLYERLIRHPDVIEPSRKEPHWLTRGRLGGAGTKNTSASFSEYVNNFLKLSLRLYKYKMDVNTSSTEITGDCSASTLWDNRIWPDLPRNDNPLEPVYTNADYVHKLNPDARIIVLLRDPVSRLFSDYLYFHKNGQPAQFHSYVVDAINIFSRCMQLFSLRSCVYNKELNKHSRMKVRLHIGIYFIYLMEWYRRFPSDQILILKSKEYDHDMKKILMDVFAFLGLNNLDENNLSSIVDKKKVNTRSDSNINVGKMWPETKWLLHAFYLPFNRRLALLLEEKNKT